MLINILVLLGRILMGGYFLRSAYNHFKNLNSLANYAQMKSVPMPKYAVMGTGLLLLVGGLGIILGVYIKIAVLCLSVFLVGVTFQMHQYWKVEDPMMRMAESVNFYKNLGLLGGVLLLLAIPTPWVMSLF